ncbi:14-3-3 domain containing protein [Pyrenophora tritici-repentis]|nr:14-3-3 domain containing protein [Pyrenophora tritici-repentis]KAI1554891.1 14-3-3 domain containing protein [Pyrenophora tritici-repentis]KAI1573362.1 14-3-3 domain containing protein [Pyrenophora tritici-repentis]
MASLDFDQKFLGRIAKQTEETNPFLSSALYQILGLSVLLARRLIRARKLRKLDTSRDTPSLAAYQHILWMSREGLSILELYILPYAQDNQHGPECRVLSVKLRASFYHIFCLFHNQPPVTTTNMTSTDPRHLGAPPLPLSPRNGNGYSRKTDPSRLSPPSKRAGKQPTLREPVDSIVSETSFVTNPYPSATQYATSYLPGSHPLRLSVALEHSAFLWDCLHDHDGSRRIARRAIKDVYRAQEAMDDTEFEDAAELVGILGRMMKRKSWEGTPRVGGMASPEPVTQDSPQASSGTPTQSGRPTTSAGPRPQKNSRRAAEGPPISDITIQIQPPPSATRSRANTASKSSPRQKESKSHANSPRSATQRHVEAGSPHTTPRTRRTSHESGSSTTPRAPPQGHGPRSPTTPSTVRTAHQTSGSGGSSKGTPVAGTSTPLTQSAAATLISDNMRNSPTLRRTPPTHFSSPEHHGSPFSPSQESSFARQKR